MQNSEDFDVVRTLVDPRLLQVKSVFNVVSAKFRTTTVLLNAHDKINTKILGAKGNALRMGSKHEGSKGRTGVPKSAPAQSLSAILSQKKRVFSKCEPEKFSVSGASLAQLQNVSEKSFSFGSKRARFRAVALRHTAD